MSTYILLDFFYLVVNCGELRPIPNGDVTFASTDFGSIATYSCDFGFTLVGSNTRICQLGGQWSEKEPFCRCMFHYTHYE